MSKGGRFSAYEGILFITIIIVSKIQYTSVSLVVKQVGTASWYAPLISCITTIIFFLLLCTLMNRFPGKNLVKIFEAVLGKAAGKFFCMFFSVYLLYYTVSNLREFPEMIKVYTLPDTPPSIILIFFIAVTVLASYKGIESIVRVSCINFYPIILGLIIILVLASPYYDFDYLKPYFGYGFKKSIYTGILRSGSYEEILVLPIVFTSIYSIKEFKKIGLVSLAISGIIFSISIACYLAAAQYTMGKENLSGLFQLSSIIYYNRYFQRIETVFLFSWVISAVLTVSAGFYTSIRVYCQIFEIEDHRPVLPPFALLMYVAVLIPKNISEVMEVSLRFIRQYSVAFVYGTPFLILLLSLILRKKEKQ